MYRLFLIGLALACATSLRADAADAPSSSPAPVSRPSVEQLHALAYQHMVAGQMQRAAAPLETAYKSRPPARQPRALVLNHAILDIAQKVNVLRAVKDLREYLTRMPPERPDEQAVDLLGAALQLAGRNPKSRELPIYQAGERQLTLAVAALEQARPGQRKWGPKWYDELAFSEIRVRLDEAQQQLKVEQQHTDRLAADLSAARAQVQRYNTLNMSLNHRHANVSDSYSCATCQANRRTAREAETARTNAIRAEADLTAQRLKLEQARKDVPQPEWPTQFTPIDPSARAEARPIAPPAPPAPPSPAAPSLFGNVEPQPGVNPAPRPAPVEGGAAATQPSIFSSETE